MAKFKKKIVTPAVHNVSRLDGSQERDAITKDRIKAWVENAKKLKELGVLIPAPTSHQDKNHKMVFPLIVGKDGETLGDAYNSGNESIPAGWDLANLNAGFWENFEQDTDGALIGEVDVPGDENDSKSFAGKVSKTIKQTSVLVMPGRKIMGKDGQEHEVGEHLAHVALCLHPQENGQSNFEPMAPMPESLAMSFVLAMDDITGLPDPNKPKDEELYNVITLLRSALNVALPEDVTREDFLKCLKLALTQKLADQREQKTEEGVRQRPEDGVSKSPSIAMSQTTNTPASKSEAILMSMLNKSKKKELKERIDNLVRRGQTGKAYADKVLYPRVEAFAMSASDLNDKGEFAQSSLEDLIEGLEQATPLLGPSMLEGDVNGLDALPPDSQIQELPQDVIVGTGVADLADATMDSILDTCGM